MSAYVVGASRAEVGSRDERGEGQGGRVRGNVEGVAGKGDGRVGSEGVRSGEWGSEEWWEGQRKGGSGMG